jgi:hypothetical protein
MSRCNVCGRRLSLREAVVDLLTRPEKSYPFVAIDGARREQPVRHLCVRCSRRADHHRNEQGISPSSEVYPK